MVVQCGASNCLTSFEDDKRSTIFSKERELSSADSFDFEFPGVQADSDYSRALLVEISVDSFKETFAQQETTRVGITARKLHTVAVCQVLAEHQKLQIP